MDIKLNEVTLVIATFNEEESIEFVLNEIKNYDFHEILLIDNNSKDRTVEIAKKYKVKVLYQKNKGWGSAVKEAFSQAKGNYITYMDGDGSYNPNAIIEMLKIIDRYDFVCASRYKFNNISEDDTYIRSLGNKFFTFITKYLMNLNISDSLFFYPLIRREDYNKIKPSSNNFGLCVEVPYLLSKNNLTYTDILSLERKRIGGKTKVNAFKDGFKILFEMIKMTIRN